MSTLIDLFILLALTVGTLVTVAAALFVALMLFVALWDLLINEPESAWDYPWDAPFNMDEEV